MYNGIGLQTARGSGTNGYVQSNLSHLMQARRKIEYNGEEDLRKMEAEINKKPNEDIMDHNRKRHIEVKCTEFEILLEDKGLDDEDIERKVNEYRQNLLKQLESGELNVDNELNAKESHARRLAAAQNRDRMRNALGLDKDYVPGSSMAKMNKSDVVGAALNSELPQEDDKAKLIEQMRQHRADKKRSKKSRKDSSSSSSSSSSDSGSESDSDSDSEKRRKQQKKLKRKEMEERREKLRQKGKEQLEVSEIKKEEPYSSDEEKEKRREDKIRNTSPENRSDRRREGRDYRRDRSREHRNRSREDRRRRSVDREDRRDHRRSVDRRDRRRSPERRRQRSPSVEKRHYDRRERSGRSTSRERRRRRTSSNEERRSTLKRPRMDEFEVKQEPPSDSENGASNTNPASVRVGREDDEADKAKERSGKKSSSDSSSSSSSDSASSSSSSSSSSDSESE